MISEQLVQKVKRLPDAPGVYLFKDAVGRVIYVGKARSLKKRVRSYLTDRAALPPKLQVLQAQLKDLDYIVTDSEMEALVLECNLIKEYRPRYNVNLRDDKDYPYLRLTAGPYPRLEYLRLTQKGARRRSGAGVARKEAREGEEEEGRFFGPYTSAGAVRETIRLLGKVFPLRRCCQPLTGEPASRRPCLNYQMKRCLAPCRGAAAVPPEVYAQMVEKVTLFLEGKHSALERSLERQMNEAARHERFEEAARLRDQLLAMRQVSARQQKVVDVARAKDQDVLALVRREEAAAVHLFKIREGKLLSQEHFRLSGAAGIPDGEALSAFIKSYYSRGGAPPAEVTLSHAPEEKELLERWLRQSAGYKVALHCPRRGYRKGLVEMAARNGMLQLEGDAARVRLREQLPLEELAALAGLPAPPRRIEGFDISHLRGGEAVGSMVVFEEGRPYKDGYRYFHLKRTPPGDDYAALREVLRRRGRRREWPLPDLVIIDGGKGQLNAARQGLAEAGLPELPAIALAKNPEQIFLEGMEAPVILPAGNTTLQLLQRIRDEAHRFALEYHRRLRRHLHTSSSLERIPGVGPQRRAALLKHFGGMEALLRASAEEIAAVPGFNKIMAQRVYRHLHLL